MRLLEHQGKALFEKVGLSVPSGEVARTPAQAQACAEKLGGTVVVKAQVLAGGRGKAGGVKLARTPQEARAHAEAILGMRIKGERVQSVLVTRAVDILKEFYLSITLDRAQRKPVLIFSTQGGVDIEEVARTHPQAIARCWLDPLLGPSAYQIRGVLYESNVDQALFKPLHAIILKLYQAFAHFEATLVEINPLALTPAGELLTLDAKVILDDDAAFRQRERATLGEEAAQDPLEHKAQQAGLQYVKLDGNIGIIGNGAGLVMSTLDVVQLAGGKPANFLDIGGGATAEVMEKALGIVLSDPQVQGLFVNIFGGITRGDEVAKGLIAARQRLGIHVPMVVRLTGTNEAEGRKLLQAAGIAPVASMEEGARQIVDDVTAMIAK
ncbi:MAG TPA: ADP-forming succinate--CoA ligase subunit beta [Candidatus Bipolaricaulota bacterium]